MHFFGLPVREGRVLYIEVDTPELGVAPRLKKVPPAEGVWFLFMEPLSIPNVSEAELDQLALARDEVRPDLVVVNTLRNCHDFDDRESRVPKLVYSFFRKFFSGSSILFTSHNRKSPIDPRVIENDKESFSGSKHFLDDAQVGLHLKPYRRRDGKENLRLYHFKSQVSEMMRPLPLKLARDGSTITCPLYEELLVVYECIHAEMAKGEIDRCLMERFGLSSSTARTRRAVVEAGLFPGSRDWLSETIGEEEME